MPRVGIECLYCGKKEERYFYDKSDIENAKCFICGDSNLKVFPSKDSNSSNDVFGYNSQEARPDAYLSPKRQK